MIVWFALHGQFADTCARAGFNKVHFLNKVFPNFFSPAAGFLKSRNEPKINRFSAASDFLAPAAPQNAQKCVFTRFPPNLILVVKKTLIIRENTKFPAPSVRFRIPQVVRPSPNRRLTDSSTHVQVGFIQSVFYLGIPRIQICWAHCEFSLFLV